MARKALEKVNPGFKNYFSRALAYGVDSDRMIGYLTDRFESDAQRDYKSQLERGAANNTLRPDEMVSRSQIGNAERPAKLARAALSTATGAYLGGGDEQQETLQRQQFSPLERFKMAAPKLSDFVEKKISEGRKPADAAFDARQDHKLKNEISLIFGNLSHTKDGKNGFLWDS